LLHSAATIRSMLDYRGTSRAQLIERLRELEAKIAADALQQAQATTERKRERTALREGEARLRAILDTAVEGIITIDERGIIESFNPAAERIFGYQAGEIMGHNVSALMPMPFRRDHDGYMANYARTGHARIIGVGREVVGQRKDGTTFPMDLSVSEVKLDDRRLFTGFVRDITERKRLEKEILEISERERGSIGHSLHDGLCQHLAGIELMSQVLEQNVAKQSKPAAAQAAKIARHVRDAISQTRMLARGLSPVSIEANGLMSALQELAENVSVLFKMECRFECAKRMLVKDNAVATHLYRIAQEAINNAIRHGKARKVVVRLEQNGMSGRLIVSDHGMGFPKGRADNGGMGMRIMKYRAGMIGASLEITPATGRGTVVTCTFNPGS
jgi:two-component system sensor kinase FixL